MLREQFREGIAHVGQALRDPDVFAVRYHRGEVGCRWWVWGALWATAVLGTTTYGMTMGIHGGAATIFAKGLACTLAAGLAWTIPLPALYILNSWSGSRLSAATTVLGALVTVSWGGLAMISSIPVNWFFSAAVPHAGFLLFVNLAIFTAVGVAMIDVFGRVFRMLEPHRGTAPVWWLALVSAIGIELFYFFGLFDFSISG